MIGNIVFILVIALSNVAYHWCQKSLSANGKPFLTLSVVYLLAFFLTLVISLRLEKWDGKLPVSPALAGLAVALIGIEAGFLYAYRSGWQVGMLSAITGPCASFLLLTLGALVWKESITPLTLGGILVSTLGVTLIRLGA